LDYNVNVKTTH